MYMYHYYHLSWPNFFLASGDLFHLLITFANSLDSNHSVPERVNFEKSQLSPTKALKITQDAKS